MKPLQRPQGPFRVAGGLIFHGKHRCQRPVYRQKHTGRQLHIPGQGHLALFHKVRAAHEHRFAPDIGLHAALLAVVHPLHRQVKTSLGGELALQQRRQAAASRPGYRRGVGHRAAALLAEDLIAVQCHRSRREQIVVRQHQPPRPADRLRPGIACGCTAAAAQPPGQIVHGQGPAEGNPQPRAGGGQRRQHPGEIAHISAGKAHHAGQHRRRGQHQRQGVILPSPRRIGLAAQTVKALCRPLLPAYARRRHRRHIGHGAVEHQQMVGVPQCRRLQVQTPLAGQDQQRAGGGIGCGSGTARDHAAHTADQLRQHGDSGAQLTARLSLTQQRRSLLPHRYTGQRRQQQTAAQHGTAQQCLVQPCGGQLFQLLQHRRSHQCQRREHPPYQSAAQPAAPALGLPQHVLRQGLRLRRFLRLRFLLRLVEQLLGVLKSRTASLLRRRTVEPLQHRRKTLPQGHRLGDDAVVLVLQHRVHRLGHDILQRHPIRRGGLVFRLVFLRGSGLRRGLRLRWRYCLRYRHGSLFLCRRLRCRRFLRRDRLTPTLAVLGKDGLQ